MAELASPQEQEISDIPQRQRLELILWIAEIFSDSDQALQKHFKASDVYQVDQKIRSMDNGKFPIEGGVNQAKRDAQQKGIQRAPIAVHQCAQTRVQAGPGDFDVRNAVGVHLIAVSANLEQTHGHGREPK
jgi:hypothetical protein